MTDADRDRTRTGETGPLTGEEANAREGNAPGGETVREKLTGDEGDTQAYVQLMYEQASELDAVERVRRTARETGRRVTGTAQQAGRRVADVAREFARDVSEALRGRRGNRQ